MPRSERTKTDVVKKWSPKIGADGPGGKRPRRESGEGGLDQIELVTAACRLLSQGHPPSQIKRLLAEEYGIDVNREVPYQLIAYAASRGWIRFVPPQEHLLREHLKETYGCLHDVCVVHTAAWEDVAWAGAKTLLELVQGHGRPPTKQEVHIGFAGGYSMREVARRFADLLTQPVEALPRKLIFHALVAGFDVYNPTTDPNGFFTYFVQDPAMQVQTGFVSLHAPALVEAEQLAQVWGLKEIQQARNHRAELDIIVTSASRWDDEHSMLKQYMKSSGESPNELEKAGCVGDMLWQPVHPKAPIEIETKVRAMTIMDLREVSEFVGEGKEVLLVAGPCSLCHAPKDEIVGAILNQEKPLVTHLATDSRCAREVLANSRA